MSKGIGKTLKSQQAAREDRISTQQASVAGRFILAFANTPMQYNREIFKAASDIKNNRGDTGRNVMKIGYYLLLQNFLFSSLQQALFAVIGMDVIDFEHCHECLLLKSRPR